MYCKYLGYLSCTEQHIEVLNSEFAILFLEENLFIDCMC